MSGFTELKAGRELDALVAEHVMGEVLAYAPCGDSLTRTDRFAAATMDEANEAIRRAYARHIENGMKLWPAHYIGPAYSTEIEAAWGVVEKMRGVPGWAIPIARGNPDLLDLAASEAAYHICLAALKAVGYDPDDPPPKAA